MTIGVNKISWALDPVHSSVEVSINHMVVGRAKVRFPKFEVDLDFDDENPERFRFEARLDPSSVDSGDPKRDGHLRSPDFFDVENYPWIVFRSGDTESVGQDEYVTRGELTIRDVTKEVVLDVTLNGTVKDPYGNERIGVTAQATVSRKEYGLEWNVPLEGGGVMVGDKIKIDIEAQFVKQGQ